LPSLKTTCGDLHKASKHQRCCFLSSTTPSFQRRKTARLLRGAFLPRSLSLCLAVMRRLMRFQSYF
jgi:hypothetical protein